MGYYIQFVTIKTPPQGFIYSFSVFLDHMLKTLLKNLFVTFIYSALIAVIALRVSYLIDERFVRNDIDASFEGLPEWVILSNAVISIISLPVLLLTIRKIYNNNILRFVVYYGPSTILLIWLSNFLLLREEATNRHDISVWILICGPMLIFLAIHTYFYLRLINNPTDRNNSSIAI
jgi:hypothetical protein